MSAYLVSKRHIDALVQAAEIHGRQFGISYRAEGERWKQYRHGEITSRAAWNAADVTHGGNNELGAMLWLENLQSVSERYPEDQDGQRPGPVGLTTASMLAYAYAPPAKPLTVVEALKALACYEYQACEHDEWKMSEAKSFCDNLRSALIHALPGYEAAPWGVD